MRGEQPNIAPSLQTVLSRHQKARLLVQEAAARHGAAVVDPLSIMCGPERCGVEEGRVPLYSDSDHLTPAGAERLAPLFQQWFAPAR